MKLSQNIFLVTNFGTERSRSIMASPVTPAPTSVGVETLFIVLFSIHLVSKSLLLIVFYFYRIVFFCE